MKRFVWICIFSIMSIIPIFTIGRVIALQQIYSQKNEGIIIEESNYSERGPIFDRNGNILAMQIKSWNVGLRLIDTQEPEEVIETLSETLDIPQETLRERLKNPKKYVRVKKFISKKEYDKFIAYKKEGKLLGVQINAIPWRKYPGNDSIAHVIGYFGESGKGLDGIEASFEKYLSPIKKNGLGNSVYLTIDSVLQKSIEEILKETLEESNPSYISTILMDAKTGNILAYVELPSFDLNKYYQYTQNDLSNKILSDSYEPGSVFKIFSLASMLDTGIIEEHTLFDAGSPYVDPKYHFEIKDINYHGIITTSEIIKYSSNVGTALASYNMDSNLLYQYLTDFGFGQKTGLPLPGESTGVLYSPKHWSARSKQTISLGQEIGITAMQMVSAATSIANKGLLLKPNIIEKIVSPNGKVIFQSEPQVVRRVIQAKTAEKILEMMNLATMGGTATRIKINGINISAKTGTAQVFDVEEKKYSESDFIASTLAIVPTEDPQLIVYSVIHKPTTGSTYGGRTTAPMIKKMFSFILPYLGLVGTHVVVNDEDTSLPSQNDIHDIPVNGMYEDYTGLSKRQVWTLFANSNIKINMHGNGVVISQNPSPGTSINQINQLDLYFE